MDLILLWNWGGIRGDIRWALPARGLSGAEVLAFLGIADPDPVVDARDGRPPRRLSALVAEKGFDAFSGRVLGWPDEGQFTGAQIAGATAGKRRASGTAILPLPDAADARAESPGGATATLERAKKADPDFTRTLIEAIEALPEAFVLYDADDRMVVCNEQYRRLYPTVADMMRPGMSFQDVLKESVRRDVFHLTEDAEVWTRRRLSFHRASIGFFEQHLADGRWIQVSERKTPSGGTTSIRADITVLKEREWNLRAALAKAEDEIAARTRFVAKVGHELRNPLNVVYNIAQMLSEETLPPAYRGMVKTLFGAASAMRDVLGDVLDVTSLRTGQLNIRQQTTPTRPLLREIVGFARLMARRNGVSFRSHTDRDLPPRILTDPGRIRQILFNLLGNAFKYAPAGSVVMGSAVSTAPDGAPVLRISVTDSGKGIDSALGRQLFTPYTRQREHRLAGIDGLGLGLSISEELAGALGATLGVASVETGGTCAWIELPVYPEEVLSQSPAPQPPAPVTTASGPALDILVVDDEPANLIVAEAVLRRLGHAVTTAQSGQEALGLLLERSFDAALLDISMPDMSGLELADAIVTGGIAEKSMALIAMTGNVMPADIKTYFDAGVTAFIEKPIDVQALAETLSSLRGGPGGKPPLQPEERVRFPRHEKHGTFDRAALDRMLDDIGPENVAAIVTSGMATFRSALALITGSRFSADELHRSLHKVHAVAGLLGFDRLAALADDPEPADAHKALQEALALAVTQMEGYALEVSVATPYAGGRELSL